jgi:hypothetical protein
VSREERIHGIALIIAVGFAVAVFYHYWLGTYYGMGYPYNTFLFRPEDRWMDFKWLVQIGADPYSVNRGFPNLPFLCRYAWLFSGLDTKVGLVAHVGTFALFFLGLGWANLKTSSRLSTCLNVFIVCGMSYPFLISIDRANFEITAFMCVSLFVILYGKRPIPGAVLLGVAVALKGFPGILALLLVTDRKWKELLVVVGVAIATTVASYMSFPGGFAQAVLGHLDNITRYNESYLVGNEGLYFGHNLYGAVKFILLSIHSPSVPSPLILPAVLVLGLVLTAGYLLLVEKVQWRRIVVLVCALCLLPVVSGDYKLLYLFIPLYLFTNKQEAESVDWLYVALFGLLLIPKNYLRIPSEPEANIGVLLNPLLLLALAGLTVAHSFRTRIATRRALPSQ